MAIRWQRYPCRSHYDELISAPGKPRAAALRTAEYLASLGKEDLQERRRAAESAINVMGITFTVYSEGKTLDRAWPFDIVPRIIPRSEWMRTEAGLKQRVRALNHFIQDIYGEQRIIRDGIFPAEVLAQSVNFRRQCVGVRPPLGI